MNALATVGQITDLHLPIRGITLRRDWSCVPVTYRHEAPGITLEIVATPLARVRYAATLSAEVDGYPIRNTSVVLAGSVAELETLLSVAGRSEAIADALCMLSARGKS